MCANNYYTCSVIRCHQPNHLSVSLLGEAELIDHPTDTDTILEAGCSCASKCRAPVDELLFHVLIGKLVLKECKLIKQAFQLDKECE